MRLRFKPDEAHKPVAAEDGHHRDVSGVLQSLLKILIGTRGPGSFGAVAGMAVKVRQDQNLEIEIYGEGVEKHEAGIYRLTNLN